MTLEEEKEKIYFSHKLQKKRNYIDKFIIGVLIIILGVFAERLVEAYKSNLEKERFIIKERISAIKLLRESHSKLAAFMLDDIFKDKAETKEYKRLYINELNGFMHIINGNNVLFSKSIDVQLNRVYWIHESVAYRDVDLKETHREFVHFVIENFDDITRQALWEEAFGLKSRSTSEGIAPLDWTHDDMIGKRSSDYFNASWSHWRNSTTEVQ